jgi:outer membrane protein assembly factor BamB
LLSVLSACGSVKDLADQVKESLIPPEPVNPPTPLKEIKATISPKILWKASMQNEEDTQNFTPAVLDSFVFAISSDGTFVKFDIASGKSIWQMNIGEMVSSGVGIGEDHLFLGLVNGYLSSYDFNGKLLWKTKLSSQLMSVPIVINSIVIARTVDNSIHGINIKDGSKIWTFNRSGPALSLKSNPGLVASDGAVYTGFPGGKLIALREDNGTLLWEVSVAQARGSTEIERITDITSLPVIDGIKLYVVAFNGKVVCINRVNGTVMWSRDISSFAGLNIEGGRIYLSHSGGAVYSLDDNSGKTYWRQGELLNRNLTKPLPMSGYIAVGDLGGFIHFLDRETGAFSGRIQLDSGVTATLLDQDNAVMLNMIEYEPGKLIAQTRRGGLYAISIK